MSLHLDVNHAIMQYVYCIIVSTGLESHMPGHIREKDRFDIALEDILLFFEEHDQSVFSPKDLFQILKINRRFWRIAEKTSARDFIDWLLQDTKLKEHTIEFPDRTYIKYSWGDVPTFYLISTIVPGAYFSHYSAVYLNGLTEQLPKSIYLNYEQSPKPDRSGPLEQEAVDRAFSRKQRTSNRIAIYDNYRIFLLSGQHTKRLGVKQLTTAPNYNVDVTNIERTLIDIAVRPVYAGGVQEVLKAYKNAHDKFSVNKLTALLKKLNYKYPYHQTIGFYLERAGVYKDSVISLLDKFPKEINFYLDYQMKNTSYSKRWKLFYPKGF